MVKKKYTLEDIKQIIKENNLKTKTDLRQYNKNLYQYCQRYGWFTDLPLAAGRSDRLTDEEVLDFVRENGITDTIQMKKANLKYYHYLYNHNLLEEAGLVVKRAWHPSGKKKRHDINKVWSFLVRWADEEGTTIREQAQLYDYADEYLEYCSLFGDPDVNRAYLPEDYQVVR